MRHVLLWISEYLLSFIFKFNTHYMHLCIQLQYLIIQVNIYIIQLNIALYRYSIQCKSSIKLNFVVQVIKLRVQIIEITATVRIVFPARFHYCVYLI